MSDTPRTDSETWRDEMDHVDTDYTFAQSATVSADFARQIERELAEAKFDLQFRRDLYALQSKELAEAREDAMDHKRMLQSLSKTQALDRAELDRSFQHIMKQRDTLAEALEMVATHTYVDGQCDNGYSPQYVAKQALAAVKGGSRE